MELIFKTKNNLSKRNSISSYGRIRWIWKGKNIINYQAFNILKKIVNTQFTEKLKSKTQKKNIFKNGQENI